MNVEKLQSLTNALDSLSNDEWVFLNDQLLKNRRIDLMVILNIVCKALDSNVCVLLWHTEAEKKFGSDHLLETIAESDDLLDHLPEDKDEMWRCSTKEERLKMLKDRNSCGVTFDMYC